MDFVRFLQEVPNLRCELSLRNQPYLSNCYEQRCEFQKMCAHLSLKLI